MRYPDGAAPVASLATSHATSRAEATWDRSPVPTGASSEVDEREFRRLDANGDAGGAFNLGVVLQQRADIDGATAAYKRAEERGDPDAAFNLGVLSVRGRRFRRRRGCLATERGDEGMYERPLTSSSCLVIAAAASRSKPRRRGFPSSKSSSIRRADESGAATGAFNLGAILHQRGDTAGALAAYERAERRGDPDAAFNLGVLLYEVGDLDGAESAWRRSAGRGHARAAENLEFLLRHRHELETAGVTGGAGDDR